MNKADSSFLNNAKLFSMAGQLCAFARERGYREEGR